MEGWGASFDAQLELVKLIKGFLEADPRGGGGFRTIEILGLYGR